MPTESTSSSLDDQEPTDLVSGSDCNMMLESPSGKSRNIYYNIYVVAIYIYIYIIIILYAIILFRIHSGTITMWVTKKYHRTNRNG